MKIKIPVGETCVLCQLLTYDLNAYGEAERSHCGLFRSWIDNNYKCSQCLKEFGEQGGKFEVIVKKV